MPHPPHSLLLVAEEDDAVRAYLTQVLTAAGYAVTPARPDLPVLVVSGGDFDVADDPHTRFLAKPFPPAELLRAVSELVRPENRRGR